MASTGKARAGSKISFIGRSSPAQVFSVLSFPGKYEDEWLKITQREESLPRLERLAVACVFYPDTDDTYFGRHAKKCQCHNLYAHVDPKYTTWHEGKAPFGCMWYNKWKQQVDDVFNFNQVGIIVYFDGRAGNREHGLGNSQKGEVQYLLEQNIPLLHVDINDFIQHILPLRQTTFSLADDRTSTRLPDAECARLLDLLPTDVASRVVVTKPEMPPAAAVAAANTTSKLNEFVQDMPAAAGTGVFGVNAIGKLNELVQAEVRRPLQPADLHYQITSDAPFVCTLTVGALHGAPKFTSEPNNRKDEAKQDAAAKAVAKLLPPRGSSQPPPASAPANYSQRSASKGGSNAALEEQILAVLPDSGTGQTMGSLEVAKACGLVTKKDVNPTLYGMQKRGLVSYIGEPPRWSRELPALLTSSRPQHHASGYAESQNGRQPSQASVPAAASLNAHISQQAMPPAAAVAAANAKGRLNEFMLARLRRALEKDDLRYQTTLVAPFVCTLTIGAFPDAPQFVGDGDRKADAEQDAASKALATLLLPSGCRQ